MIRITRAREPFQTKGGQLLIVHCVIKIKLFLSFMISVVLTVAEAPCDIYSNHIIPLSPLRTLVVELLNR